MKKLLLINPIGRKSGYLLSRMSTVPPLSLAYVAAMTPADWDVKILDENFDPFKFEEADLVGITAFTSNINRAYEIAQLYRQRKIKVVIGGIHASMLPEEALQYADAAVVGEAEGIWGKVIEDFENNQLARKYVGSKIDFTHYTIKPRRELLHPDYIFHSIQTSRGCPFNCNFCTVSKYLGKEFRQRGVANVLEELEEIKGQYLFFLDDNLIGYSEESKQRAIEIFKGMIARSMKKRWLMQTSINSADDDEVLKLAAAAGCMFVFIGFETISDSALKEMKKGINLKIGVENYQKVVAAFHRHGIGVVGTFIVGNDHESPAYYKQLAKYLMRSGIDAVQITIMTPLPGTQLMKQIQAEDGLLYHNFPNDWDRFRLSYVVRKPEGVDPETIYTGDNYVKNHIYSFPRIQWRLLKSFLSLKNPTNFYAIYRFNQALKRSWQGSHYYQKYPSKF